MTRRRITRVTTRTGDAGETALADGSRIEKSSERIHAIGSVDELNAFLGLLANRLGEGHTLAAIAGRLQQELFDLGAHLATAGATAAPEPGWLEEQVGALNARLPALTEFVIPGGTESASLAHICRTVCRRAERHAWAVGDAPDAARYLNRLSDLFFVMARTLNAGTEAQWRGPAREESDH